MGTNGLGTVSVSGRGHGRSKKKRKFRQTFALSCRNTLVDGENGRRALPMAHNVLDRVDERSSKTRVADAMMMSSRPEPTRGDTTRFIILPSPGSREILPRGR